MDRLARALHGGRLVELYIAAVVTVILVLTLVKP